MCFLLVYRHGLLTAPAVYGPFPCPSSARRQAPFYSAPADTVRIAPHTTK